MLTMVWEVAAGTKSAYGQKSMWLPLVFFDFPAPSGIEIRTAHLHFLNLGNFFIGFTSSTSEQEAQRHGSTSGRHGFPLAA
ncbi:hypothetical protein D1604_12800 [Brevundimonas sp. LPMIX5]|nr:hypothetical protein D1604_12800 [Brevundimonas sp. LPMIX5]